MRNGIVSFRLTHCQLKLAICSQVLLDDDGWFFRMDNSIASYSFSSLHCIPVVVVPFFLALPVCCALEARPTAQIAQQHRASCNRHTHIRARAKLNVKRGTTRAHEKKIETPDRLISSAFLFIFMKIDEVFAHPQFAHSLNKKTIIIFILLFALLFDFSWCFRLFFRSGKLRKFSWFLFVFVLDGARRNFPIRSGRPFTWTNTPDRSRD